MTKKGSREGSYIGMVWGGMGEVACWEGAGVRPAVDITQSTAHNTNETGCRQK